jgi:hypothetical protein
MMLHNHSALSALTSASKTGKRELLFGLDSRVDLLLYVFPLLPKPTTSTSYTELLECRQDKSFC